MKKEVYIYLFSISKNRKIDDLFILQLSLIVSKKVLYIYNLQEPDEPMKLAFEPSYGDIVSYEWLVHYENFCSALTLKILYGRVIC